MVWINEILFLSFLVGGLGLAVFSHYLGRHYLYALIVAIAIYINIAEPKVIEVFSFATTLGTVLFGVMYFSTDLLTERYGKAAGFRAVKLGIFASIIFQLFMQLTLLAEVIADEPGSSFFADFSAGLDSVFTVSFRIFAAGLFVYALSQSLDIWLFHKIKQHTGERHLWLRNNGSTIVSQALDTYLFTFLAFYGTMPLAVILQMATVGYCFKLVVALGDTAFIYAAKIIRPRDLETGERAVEELEARA